MRRNAASFGLSRRWVSASCGMAEHIALRRDNPDGSVTSMTIPNHPTLKAATLRAICTQAGIPRDQFLRAYKPTR